MKKLLLSATVMLLFCIPLLAQNATVFRENGKYGVKNAAGTVTIPPKYDMAYPDTKAPGIIITKLGNKTGFVDKNGNEATPPKYDMIYAFQNSVFVVKLNNKTGVVDASGKEIIPCVYDLLFTTNNTNQYWVKQGNRSFHIDRQGKELTQYGSTTTSSTNTNKPPLISPEEKAIAEKLSAEENYNRMLANANNSSNPSEYRGEAIKLYEQKLKDEGTAAATVNQKIKEKLLQMAEIDFYGAYTGILKVRSIDAKELLTIFSQPQQQAIRALANHTTQKTPYPSSVPAKGQPWSARGTTVNASNTAQTNNISTGNQSTTTDNGKAEFDKGYAAQNAKNYTEAMNWYRKAADKNQPSAMYNIGLMYYSGLGVTKNYSEALAWFHKAANRNTVQAMHNIGVIYHTGGQGVTKNLDEAKIWYQKAADKGFQKSKDELNKIANLEANGGQEYRNGLAAYTKKNYTEALDWFKKAVEKGNESAITYIAWFHKNGYAVTKNYTEALSWYKKVAEKDNAMYNIATIYEDGGHGVTQNYAEALNWYKKAADAGNSNAMFNLGLMYANGTGIAQNYTEAFSWYQKAAEKGNSSAMNNIGVMYSNGQGVAKNNTEAFNWFLKAANLEQTDALYNVAIRYEKGTGTTMNLTEAKKYYQKAADKGYEQAKEALAALNSGKTPSNQPGATEYNKALELFNAKKYTEAVNMLRLSAGKGNITAMFELADIYEFGDEGIPKNLNESFKWYLKAAESGDSEAMFITGEMYEKGRGTTQNPGEAFKWYQKAADKGYSAALVSIGRMYSNGAGVAQNYSEAMNAYRKAADKGNSSAMFSIGLMHANGTGVTQNYAEALSWYQKSAEKGNSAAMNNIGVMYNNGQGVAKNNTEAFNWFLKAANLGQINALYNVAVRYEKGIGTPMNLDEAKKYYKQAAEKGYKQAQDALTRLGN